MNKERGQRRATLRRWKGWSQKELASHSDVSVSAISNLENGHPVSERLLRKIANALGLESWLQYAEPELPEFPLAAPLATPLAAPSTE